MEIVHLIFAFQASECESGSRFQDEPRLRLHVLDDVEPALDGLRVRLQGDGDLVRRLRARPLQLGEDGVDDLVVGLPGAASCRVHGHHCPFIPQTI